MVERSTFWWLVKQGLPWGGQVIKNFAYQLLQGADITNHESLNVARTLEKTVGSTGGALEQV